MVSRVVASSLFGVKTQETTLTAPEGAGALSCFCLTRGAIFPYLHGNVVHLIRLKAVVPPLARHAVPNLLPVPLGHTLSEAHGLACYTMKQGL